MNSFRLEFETVLEFICFYAGDKMKFQQSFGDKIFLTVL